MKANISKKEIESGREIIEKLSQLNPKLLPHHLQEIISGYKKFLPHISKYGLWSSKKSKNKKNKNKYDKIFLMISGIAASGKDAIREEMSRISPYLFIKTITGTSRQPREGEIHGRDYYFFQDSTNFKKSIKNGDFLEWVKQGDRFYGLPKESLNQSLNHSAKIICSQVEMSAWTKVEKHVSKIENVKILTLKVFVLPNMNFSEYQNWLNQKRDDDVDARMLRTGWEIKKAPKKADFIITNNIGQDTKNLTLTAQTIINELSEFLDEPLFEKFDSPFNTDKKIKDIEEILKIHNSL